MFSALRSAARRRGALLAAGTAVVVAVGGGTTAAFAAGSSTDAHAPSATFCSAPHLRALLHGGAGNAAFRADLKKLHAEPKGQRAAERKEIREKALAGDYGQRVERVAHLFGHAAKGHGWFASLPTNLQNDLKALRKLPAKSTERKEAAQKIATNALNGTYGSTIQAHAQAAQKRIQQRCTAAGTSGSSSSNS